ncbi:hypothetical protein ACLMJK_001616 [Lecanora helva]
MRDLIYSHLLDSDYIKDVDRRGASHNHLAILQVSKSVSDQAKETLYRDMTFKFCFTNCAIICYMDLAQVDQLVDELPSLLGILTGFEKLEVGFCHPSSDSPDQIDKRTAAYRNFDEHLSLELGPGKGGYNVKKISGLDDYTDFVMEYYPRKFVERMRS